MFGQGLCASAQIVGDEIGHFRMFAASLTDVLEDCHREALALDLSGPAKRAQEGAIIIATMIEPILEADQFVIGQLDTSASCCPTACS